MRIALLAHLRQPIAEPFMGGMEAHSWNLADGLIARGHDVTLFASGDSDPRFAIFPVLDEHYDRTFPGLEHRNSPALHAYVDTGFERACAHIADGGFDIVHNNSLHRFPLQRAKAGGTPTLTSLHVPPFEGLDWFVRTSAAPRHWITVTSRRQLDVWWPDGTPPEAVVAHNGIDPDLWPFSATGDGTAVWCGRIARNKGPHLAIVAALQAGIALKLYGVIEERDYFDEAVAPLLGPRVEYGGHLKAQALAQAVGSASALLFTPCWDEPFGLVAIEAMACGLPVAAIDKGAAREVIGEDVGRFAPEGDINALSTALIAAMRLDRHSARQRVTHHFSRNVMLARYEELYNNAIAGARA